MQSSRCPGCTLGSAKKPSCSYRRTPQPFPLIRAPTSKKPTKGALRLQAKAAASQGHPALHLPCWGNSLQEQTQGIWCMIVNFKPGMVTTFPVLSSWPGCQNPPLPVSPSQQHLVSHLCHTAVSREPHIMGHIAIQIQVNISLYEKTTTKLQWHQSLWLWCQNLNRASEMHSLQPCGCSIFAFPWFTAIYAHSHFNKNL